jgi:esterase/lipase superfamily enzyme
MSGVYDLEKSLHGRFTMDFYFSSPIHFIPNLSEGDHQLQALRHRFIVLAYGQGRWEHPEESWRLSGVLGGRGIPNRVDPWGQEWDHDWPSWRRMLPLYLDDLAH